MPDLVHSVHRNPQNVGNGRKKLAPSHVRPIDWLRAIRPNKPKGSPIAKWNRPSNLKPDHGPRVAGLPLTRSRFTATGQNVQHVVVPSPERTVDQCSSTSI